RHGTSDWARPCCRLRSIAGSHRGSHLSSQEQARRRPARERGGLALKAPSIPPITYWATDMPAFSAACGSFHVKSSFTSFGFRDSAGLAVLLDCRLDLFLHFDGIDLRRAVVHRPEILVDALFAQDALIRSFERAHINLWLGKRHFYDWISDGGRGI